MVIKGPPPRFSEAGTHYLTKEYLWNISLKSNSTNIIYIYNFHQKRKVFCWTISDYMAPILPVKEKILNFTRAVARA